MNWKTYFARAGKGLAFFLIAALLFCLITRIFTPKWSGYWKSSDTVTGFYELDEDSIDTLIIGSSQVISGISPMELYQSAGLSAYSLGTEQQPVLCSYYLIREALNTQPNLKAVIFEVTELFNVCSEANYRKGLDYLPLNAAKWEAIQTHVAWAEKREAEENGETAPSALSYVLPIIAYHDRWSQLEQADFTYWRQDRTDPYRGFSIQTNRGDEGAYEPLGEDATAALAQPDPEAMEAFTNLVNLCKERSIDLLLLKTPRSDWTAEEHNTTSLLAEQNDLAFLDFNTPQLQKDIDYDYATDNLLRSPTHLNLSGAQKVSAYLGDYLTKHCAVADVRGTRAAEPLEAELPLYLAGVEDGNLSLKEDLPNFLLACQKARYSVLFAVNGRGSDCTFPQADRDAMTELGLDTRFCAGGNYLAVLEHGTIPLQQWGGTNLSQSITLADGAHAALTSSASGGSISIDGVEVDVLSPGLNIVVYNHDSGQVVDAIACRMDEQVVNEKTGKTEKLPLFQRQSF